MSLASTRLSSTMAFCVLACVGIILLTVLGGQASPLVRKTRQLPGFPLASQQVFLPFALGSFNFIQPDYLTSGKFSVEDQSNADIFTGDSYGVVSQMVPMTSTASTSSGGGVTAAASSTSSPVTAATCAPAPTSCPPNSGCTQRIVVQGLDSSGCPLYACALDMCPMGPF